MTKKDIEKLVESDSWMMEILELVDDLKLNDWIIGAGFVRSKVWDHLHGYEARTPIPDIDVIYFDENDSAVEGERNIWSILKQRMNGVSWSVTNTAHRHLRTGNKPYKSSEDALSSWIETATCVGVRLKRGRVELVAPNGTEDLVNLVLRPTRAEYLSELQNRIEKKRWLSKWPKLQVKQVDR